MINYSSEKIEEAIDALPLEAQQMLFHPNTEYEVRRIGAEAGFVDDQIKTLNVFANFIIMGLLNAKDFSNEVKINLNTPETQAVEVAEKILKEVISPILEFKEKIILKQKAEEEAKILDEVAYSEFLKEQEIEKLLGQKEEVGVDETNEEKITPTKTWEKMPDVAPDNLPVGGEKVESEKLKVESWEQGGDGGNEKLKTKNEKIIDEVEIPFIPNLIAKTRPEGSGEEDEPHPFEEKMKKVFTGTSTTIGDLAIETPSPKSDISLSSDPYREPIG